MGWRYAEAGEVWRPVLGDAVVHEDRHPVGGRAPVQYGAARHSAAPHHLPRDLRWQGIVKRHFLDFHGQTLAGRLAAPQAVDAVQRRRRSCFPIPAQASPRRRGRW